MKQLIAFVFVITCFYGCKSDIKDTIVSTINQHCKNEKDSCGVFIKMQDVTDFKWDKLYYFNVGTSLEDIDKSLGFHYPFWQDLSESIVFTSGNNVVYHEEHAMTNPSNKPNDGFTFNITSGYLYTPQNAVFIGSRIIVNGFKYYELSTNTTTHTDSTNKYISSTIDSLITDKIGTIPEVIQLNKRSDSINIVTIWVKQVPDTTLKYYVAQAGYTHPERFEPVYTFYVVPNKLDVLYYDTVTDSLLTLEQWRSGGNKYAGKYIGEYGKHLKLDTNVALNNANVHIISNYDVNRSYKLPQKYVWDSSLKAVKIYYSQTMLVINSDNRPDTIRINENTFAMLVNNDNEQIQHYGVLISPHIHHVDKTNKIITMTYSYSIPFSDIGVQVKAIIDFKNNKVTTSIK